METTVSSPLDSGGVVQLEGTVGHQSRKSCRTSGGRSTPEIAVSGGEVLRYCRNVRPTWVKFDSKDTKESEWCSRF